MVLNLIEAIFKLELDMPPCILMSCFFINIPKQPFQEKETFGERLSFVWRKNMKEVSEISHPTWAVNENAPSNNDHKNNFQKAVEYQETKVWLIYDNPVIKMFFV